MAAKTLFILHTRQRGFVRRQSRIYYGNLEILEILKIQNGGTNMAAKILFNLNAAEKLIKRFSWGADHESAIGFWKFRKLKMVDPI